MPGTDVQQYGDTTFYTIPTPDIPLFDPARVLGVPESLIDIVEPFAKAVVDAGYDRTIPYGEPTPLRVVPRVDPVKFTSDIVTAVGTGMENALNVLSPRNKTAEDTDPAIEVASEPVTQKAGSKKADDTDNMDDAVIDADDADIAGDTDAGKANDRDGQAIDAVGSDGQDQAADASVDDTTDGTSTDNATSQDSATAAGQ
jgi:hypothetical protein